MEKVSLDNLELAPHPVARSQAKAKRKISAGTILVSVPAFASALLEVEKGRRCDGCFRLPLEGERLKKCTGCASYYYCDTDCQKMDWSAGHKHICKVYSKMTASSGFSGLAQHERMDILLLSHFLTRVATTSHTDSPLSVFLSLLPASNTGQEVPNVLPTSLTKNIGEGFPQSIYSRFGNNNFTIHSHMNTIGHGAFPLASRLFNHSCVPNAAPRYILNPAQPLIMEVVALRGIDIGEEVCVPYLDPALTESRHQAFQYTYGFTCECSSCAVLRRFGQTPNPPVSASEMSSISDALRNYVGVNGGLSTDLPKPTLVDLPETLRSVLHESFMGIISEEFSRESHEGEYDAAVANGLTLLALYLLIYPVNYPQIGLHLLELAKTRWNAQISSENSGGGTAGEISQVRITLDHAQKILSIYGEEGDTYGPLHEARRLELLLRG